MKIIRSFSQFISEAQFSLSDPSTAGEKLAGVLAANKDVKEVPKSSNKGPEVNQYLQSVGLGPGLPWCAAFVYYIFDQLSKQLGTTNPLPKTGGVMNHWGKAGEDVKITIDQARSNPNLVRPGQIFIMSRPGKGLGHTGIVVSVDPTKKTMTTMEGNTNDQLSGEGDRVGINTRKLEANTLIGFLDYFKNSRTAEFEADLSKAITGQATALPPLSADDVPSDDVVGPAKTDAGGQLMAQALGNVAAATAKNEVPKTSAEVPAELR
jgi:hypothetical protein